MSKKLIFILFFLTVEVATYSQSSNDIELVASESLKISGVKIQKGEKFKHRFTLLNKSDKSVKIVSHSASCSCTELILSKETIKPKENLYINVVIDTADKHLGAGRVGVVIKTDGKRKFYYLSVKFEVV